MSPGHLSSRTYILPGHLSYRDMFFLDIFHPDNKHSSIYTSILAHLHAPYALHISLSTYLHTLYLIPYVIFGADVMRWFLFAHQSTSVCTMTDIHP